MKIASTAVLNYGLILSGLIVIPINCLAENIFKNAPVIASKTHSSTKPTNITDGDLSNAWNAGSHAPVWIQIDYISSSPNDPLAKIRLIPSQSPSGLTEHVVSYTGSDGIWKKIATISKETSDNVPVDIFPDVPIKDITKLKIETTKSPSWVAWKEIQGFVESEVRAEIETQKKARALAQQQQKLEDEKRKALQEQEARCLQDKKCRLKKELEEKQRLAAEKREQDRIEAEEKAKVSRACNKYHAGYLGNIEFQTQEREWYGPRTANHYGNFIVVGSGNGMVSIKGVIGPNWRGGGNYPSPDEYLSLSCSRLTEIER